MLLLLLGIDGAHAFVHELRLAPRQGLGRRIGKVDWDGGRAQGFLVGGWDGAFAWVEAVGGGDLHAGEPLGAAAAFEDASALALDQEGADAYY